MTPKNGVVVETGQTQATFKRTLPCVDTHVPHKRPLLGEFLVALFTLVWPPLAMYVLVQSEALCAFESLAADVAHVAAHVRVNAAVNTQAGLGEECNTTHLAREGPHTEMFLVLMLTVHCLVIAQLAADCAQVMLHVRVLDAQMYRVTM